MHPLSNNPHLIEDLARERYNDLRREADAWRLAREVQEGAAAPCAPADSPLARTWLAIRVRFSGAPRAQLAGC